MWRLILVTFAFLGWSFYVISDGSNYQPRDGSRQAMALLQAQEAKVAKVIPAKAQPTTAKADAVLTLASTPATTTLNVNPGRLSKNFISARVIEPQTVAPAVDAKKVATLLNPDSFASAMLGSTPDLRSIVGTRVNMRAEPSTSAAIAAKLTGGTAVEVLQEPGNGWLQIRVVDTRQIGWMADFLVTTAAD